jgi:Protein of unknown function (DUF642)
VIAFAVLLGESHEANSPIHHRRCCAHERVLGSANLIRNGGFEDEAFGDGSVRVISPGGNDLPGWTVHENPIDWYTTGYEPSPLIPIGVGPHSGSFAVNLCDGSVRTCDGSVRVGSVSQTIATLPFREYQLSYWVGNYSGNGGPARVLTTITDGTSNTIFEATTAAPATDAPSTWEHFVFNFLTDGTSNTITFGETTDPTHPPLIAPTYVGLDDVTVVAVPESSTWALALLGLAGLGMVGIRRRAMRLT